MNTINLTVVIGENATLDGNVLTTTLTDEQVREARGVWPCEGDQYWCIRDSGTVTLLESKGIIFDSNRQAIGNVYRTEAEAIRERDIRLATQRVKTWIRDNGMDFVPDWKNDDQPKWHAHYNHSDKQFHATYGYTLQYIGAVLHFATYAHAQACIDACGDDLRIIAGVA